MPTTLTDDPSIFPAITVPAATDARGYASVQTPFQQLADRTRQSKNRLDAIAPATDGVRFVRRVANDAALLAVSAGDTADKQLCIVDDLGIYEYDAASTATASVPFVRTPTFVGGGAGRWILVGVGYGALNAAFGIPQCDSAGRVPAASVRNGLVAVGHAECGTFSTDVANPSWADVTGTTIALNGLAIGDIVMVDYSSATLLAATSVLNTRGVLVLPDTSVIQPANLESDVSNGAASSADLPIGCVGTYVVTQAGNHMLKVQANTDSGAHTNSLLDLNVRALVFRP